MEPCKDCLLVPINIALNLVDLSMQMFSHFSIGPFVSFDSEQLHTPKK